MNENELAERLEQRLSGEEVPSLAGVEPTAEIPASEPEPEQETRESEFEPEPEPEPEPQLYAGRYRSVEELERAVQEKEQYIARQGNELGELRRAVSDLGSSTSQQIAELRSSGFDPDEDWEEWADEELSGDEDQALEAIIAAGDEAGPAAAKWVLDRWHTINPAAAVSFQLIAHRMDQEQSQPQYAEPQHQLPEPELAVETAYDRVRQRNPDLDAQLPSMRQALLNVPRQEQEFWARRIKTYPPAGEEFLEHLYHRVKSGRGARSSQSRADQEALEATVATATTSIGRGSKPPQKPHPFWDREEFRREAGLISEDTPLAAG